MLGRAGGWLVVALAACVATLSRAQDRCTIATYGVINDHPHSVPREILAAGIADWEVTIQTVCPDEVGVMVTVCEWDVPPRVSASSLSEARVHREGSLRREASIDAVFYCADAPSSGTQHQHS